MKCIHCGTVGAQPFPGEKSETPKSFYCGYCKKEFANPILYFESEEQLLEYWPQKFVLYAMSGLTLSEFSELFVNKRGLLPAFPCFKINSGRVRSRFFASII